MNVVFRLLAVLTLVAGATATAVTPTMASERRIDGQFSLLLPVRTMPASSSRLTPTRGMRCRFLADRRPRLSSVVAGREQAARLRVARRGPAGRGNATCDGRPRRVRLQGARPLPEAAPGAVLRLLVAERRSVVVQQQRSGRESSAGRLWPVHGAIFRRRGSGAGAISTPDGYFDSARGYAPDGSRVSSSRCEPTRATTGPCTQRSSMGRVSFD